MNAVKEELERMVELGVIRPVQEATEWCAGMVVVPKVDGKVCICVDFTKLNESECRELHMLPCMEQILAQLSGAKVGVTWACERFRDYLMRLQFQIEMESLVPLLGSKNLEDLPLRVLRFRLRLMRFKYTVSHIPGKELIHCHELQ